MIEFVQHDDLVSQPAEHFIEKIKNKLNCGCCHIKIGYYTDMDERGAEVRRLEAVSGRSSLSSTAESGVKSELDYI
jgi:hypothetical protein